MKTLFNRKPRAQLKPMGIRSTVLPPKPPASFNEWVEDREVAEFERIWADFKRQIQTHRTRKL